LVRIADGSLITLDGTPVSLTTKPDSALTTALARASVGVSHPALVHHFAHTIGAPPAWRDHALLRDHVSVIFIDGVAEMSGVPYTMRLTPALGLEIHRLETQSTHSTQEDE
jgi:hypothetical protein